VTTPDPTAPASPNRTLTGIAFKVASVIVFLAMAALLKAAEGVPAGELAFFRSFFALLPVVVFLAWRGQLVSGVKTKYPLRHLARGLAGTGGMLFGFYALTQLPFPEAVTLNYATPLIIVIISALFLDEVVRLYRWSAVVLGLVGVIIISWPRLTLLTTGVDQQAAIGVGSAMLACLFAAIAMVQVRKLVHTEKSATIVFYFSLSSAIISLATLPLGWVMPSPLALLYLVTAGIAGGIAQILLTESYRHADMSVVAPFEYTSLIFSIAIGFFAFGDVPTWHVIVGGVIVIGSALFIIFRERQLGKPGPEKEVATPQG
jgi:drug/metabolite transporter (DMT)-like permease